MTLLLLLPLSLHSFFSLHSLLIPSSFFLSSETSSLARTTILLILPFSLLFSPSFALRSSWERSVMGSLECHTLLSELLCRPFMRKWVSATPEINFQLSKNLCSPGEQGSTWLQKLCTCTSHQEDQSMQLSSYTAYPVPGKRLVTMPEVGNVPAYHKHQHSGKRRKVNSWGENVASPVWLLGCWKKITLCQGLWASPFIIL